MCSCIILVLSTKQKKIVSFQFWLFINVLTSMFYRCFRFEQVELTEFDNVMKWWEGNKGAYPRLARLARKYLAIQATSIASERIFSTGGRVFAPRRGVASVPL